MKRFALRNLGNCVALEGMISESAQLMPILDQQLLDADPCVLNLREVAGINSLGAKRFLEFVDAWGTRRFAYEECPVPMMDAFIFLPRLLGPVENTAKILSFYSPFECDACDKEIFVLHKSSEVRHQKNTLVVPSHKCPKCLKPLALQESAHNYVELIRIGAITGAKPL